MSALERPGFSVSGEYLDRLINAVEQAILFIDQPKVREADERAIVVLAVLRSVVSAAGQETTG